MVIFLICLIDINTASARYATLSGENAGINSGDVIFIGERNLDFSRFANSSGVLPARLVHTDGTRYGIITISDGTGSLTGNDITAGMYYPYYPDGTSGTSYCIVRELTLGEIGIYTYNTDIKPSNLPQQPSALAKTTDIAFITPDVNIDGANLTGNWYKYSLSRGTLTTSTITNIHQNSVGLDTLTIDPRDKPDETLSDAPVFRLIDQTIVSSQTGNVSLTAVFSTNNLNGLEKSVSYPFTASLFSPALSAETEVVQNTYFDLTVTGVPYTRYNISISGSSSGSDAPQFESGDWEEMISYQEISTHTEWTGTKTFQIYVPESAPTNTYEIEMTDADGNSAELSFTVSSGAMSLYFNEPSDEIKSGLYSVGDSISLEGYITGATKPEDVYLFITGPNLPANGAKLDALGKEVSDGEEDSFTVTRYSVVLGKWSYEWNTTDFESGTYTIYANLKPYGYTSSSYPGGPGTDINGNTPPSHDYPLSEPSLNIKFDDKNNGYFAQGDILYGWWLSRGSASELRWYIFGNNFRYADNKSGMSAGITSSGSAYDSDEKVPWNEYGFTYNRNFTYNLYPGVYYFVCQHPGPNKIFEVNANKYSAVPAVINATFGSSVNLNSMSGTEAANALIKLLDNPYTDDIYVKTKFVIEEPWIRIDDPGEISVGNSLTVSGITNLAPSGTTPDKTKTQDTLYLNINRLDMDVGSDSVTAMKIPVDETTPLSSPKGYKSFKYDPIDTSSWYPGTYQITITCKDASVKKSYTFELLGQKTSSDSEYLSSDTESSLQESKPHTASKTPATVQLQETASVTVKSTQKSGTDLNIISLLAVLCSYVAFAYSRRE
ncbi:hypothetical protein J2128_001059 [Methanomicrobium sp. W14]|uniref:hypothetical protein n=1 Tax=Methanomicrobium sp. W14 TaxID=2817839 RepID=UPI001AE9A735|nr:hypothetical protein [Methanomicrobium sp. W14]MBP2133138.1 hypothetical protein [Methanomicrobium sp. W14]